MVPTRECPPFGGLGTAGKDGSMSMEKEDLPIHFRLYEKRGEATDTLVRIIRNMSAQFGVEDKVKLKSIQTNPENDSENILRYSLTVEPTNRREGENAVKFMTNIFEKLFDNFPAYDDPS
jgi:hypothetical protein